MGEMLRYVKPKTRQNSQEVCDFHHYPNNFLRQNFGLTSGSHCGYISSLFVTTCTVPSIESLVCIMHMSANLLLS